MQSNTSRIPKRKSPEYRASLVALITNILLTAIKLICGILCTAPALIADAVHSAADLGSTLIVLAGLRLASKAPDKEHPYGHDRFECIASILLSGILLTAGIGIGYRGVCDILTGAFLAASPPMPAAIFAAALSVTCKLLLFRYMKRVAAETHSTILCADALHQLSDAFASFGALCGIVASMLAFPIFDPLASIVIALFLLRSAVSIFLEAAARLIDRSADEKTEEALRIAASEEGGLIEVRSLRTRLFGAHICVEAEILLDASLTVAECMPIICGVKNRILHANDRVKSCTIVVCPLNTPSEEASRLGEDP